MGTVSHLVLRRANLTDLSAIINLLADDELGRNREDSRTPLNSRYEAAFLVIDRDPHQLLAVASMGATVVGCLQLTFITGLSRLGMWRGQIESVRVAGSHRGQGLGEQMINWAIDTCRQHQCGLVQLTTDTRRLDAHRFYEKFGSTHTGMKMDLQR
jgi:ribosomal protein S18 acetylase RimI-like enzyme